MNRKERVLAALRGEKPDQTPTGFWLHFPEAVHHGQKAVDAHIRYFEESGTDICKVMNEFTYPSEHTIMAASDWGQVKSFNRSSGFIQNQIELIKRVVERVDGRAPVIATVHGVVASASHTLLGVPKYDGIGRHAQLYHLRTEPEAVRSAYRAIADTLCVIAEESIKAGADGIYYAALGGERDGFTEEEHQEFIAPVDKLVLETAGKAPLFNILHMCKPMVQLSRFVDYPCDVINWGVLESGISLVEGAKIFPDKVVMGGVDDRSPVLLKGTYEEVEKEVHEILREMNSDRFILASDCTLPTEINYERIAWMKRACESYEKGKR